MSCVPWGYKIRLQQQKSSCLPSTCDHRSWEEEACISPPRAEWGLLSHRVWRLSCQLSGNQHAMFTKWSDSSFYLWVTVLQTEQQQSLLMSCFGCHFCTVMQISFHVSQSLRVSNTLVTAFAFRLAVSGYHSTNTVQNEMQAMQCSWNEGMPLMVPIASSTASRFMGLLISTPLLVITGLDCGDGPQETFEAGFNRPPNKPSQQSEGEEERKLSLQSYRWRIWMQTWLAINVKASSVKMLQYLQLFKRFIKSYGLS